MAKRREVPTVSSNSGPMLYYVQDSTGMRHMTTSPKDDAVVLETWVRSETISDLGAENQELRLQCLAHETQAREAYAAQQRAEAKLATNDEIVRRAERIIDLQNELHDEVARLKSELSDADTKLQYVCAKLAMAGPILPILLDGVKAAEKAMQKFPQPNYVISKWAEETGEVTKALIHAAEGRETWTNVRGEIVQSLAMLHRLMVEGDQVHGLQPLKDMKADAAIAAMGQAEVKPLEWEDFEDQGDVRGAKAKAFYDASYLITKWSTGKYEVAVSYPGYQAIFNGPQFYDSVQAAKAAAQADYERRIRAALKVENQ